MFRKKRPNWIIIFSYQTSLHSVLLKFSSSQCDLPCITRSSAMQTNIVKQSDFQFLLSNISPYRHERWQVVIRLLSRWVRERERAVSWQFGILYWRVIYVTNSCSYVKLSASLCIPQGVLNCWYDWLGGSYAEWPLFYRIIECLIISSLTF
jgi:hypothetical protein